MIEYDYEIIRDEKDEVIKYIPDKIPREIPNIVYIEGPNTIGKSTLLNILSLGLHGSKKDKLDPALLKKIRSLGESDHQKLEYNFCISDLEGNPILKSSKNLDDGLSDIKVYEFKDGKKNLLTPKIFHNKYNLIYDIPQDPTQRIYQLVNEIKYIQKDYEKDLSLLSRYLRDTISEIKRSKDPSLIKEKKKELEENRDKVDNLESIISAEKEELRKIQKFTYSKFLDRYETEFNIISQEVRKLENKLESRTKTKKTFNTKYGNRLKEANEKLDEIRKLHYDLIDLLDAVLPEDQRFLYEIWKEFSFNYVLDEYCFEEDQKNDIREVEIALKEEKSKIGQDETLKKAQMYQKLINFLEEYQIDDIVVPGVEKNVSEFITIVKKRLEEYEKIINYEENLQKTVDKINCLMDSIKILEEEILPEVKKFKKKRSEENLNDMYYEVEDELKRKKKKQKQINSKLNQYEQKYVSLGLNLDKYADVYEEIFYDEDISSYKQYPEQDLNNKINNLKERLIENKDEISRLNMKIKLDGKEIQRLKNREKHEYADYKDLIEKFWNITNRLQKKFHEEYSKYINDLTTSPEKLKNYEKDEHLKNYYNSVFKYLGAKVEVIRHGENNYDVNRINLITDAIETDKGKEIKLSDMGTGQGQSAYLKGLLSTDDNRKIIALFDEVGAMDSSSLNPIFNKFNKLFNEGKLLVGIVVQKSDKIKVVSKVE